MRMRRPSLWRALSLFLFTFQLCCQARAAVEPVSQVKQSVDSGHSAKRVQKAKFDAASYIFRYYNSSLSMDKANEYARYVMEASSRFSVDPGLIAAIIVKESRVKVNARSKYAVGLMQVYWKLHRATVMAQFPHIRTEKILMEPRNNIMVGTWIFSRYMAHCKGNVTKALRRYLGSQANRYVALVTKYRGHYTERVLLNLQHASKRAVS